MNELNDTNIFTELKFVKSKNSQEFDGGKFSQPKIFAPFSSIYSQPENYSFFLYTTQSNLVSCLSLNTV